MTSFLATRFARRTTTPVARPRSRLVLAGVALYFCEWIGIIGAGGIDVLFKPGTSAATVIDGYAGNANAFAWAAGWFSVVLLGRVLFATGVRHGLRAAGHDDPATEVGVLAMLGGVIFEVAAYALVMAAALMTDHGARADTVVALDTTGLCLETMLWGMTGAATVALAWAMLRSALFPRVLCGLGLVAGAGLLVAGLAFSAPAFSEAQGALLAGVPLLWIWMWWTGVLMWHHAPRSDQQARAASGAPAL
jgi:hypothetical protein